MSEATTYQAGPRPAAPARQFYYPKSFLKLIFIGFVLATLPLALGLINTAISMNRLAQQSQQAVYQAAQIAHGGRVLADEVTVMERSLRQASILNDRAMLAGYRQAHTRFQEMANSLLELRLITNQRALLHRLIATERDLARRIDATQTPEQAGQFASRIVALGETVREFSALANTLIDREVDAMQGMANQSLRITQWQLFGLIPMAFVLVLGFAMLIARPISQIDAAIRRMGKGDLSEPITVDGPQDLRYVGEQLDWMRRRFQELEEQKARFLRHLSHELKTPLTALREGTTLLADGVVGQLDTEQQDVAEILKQNTLQLQKRIEDLLNYASLNAVNSRPDFVPMAIREVIQRVLNDQQLAIRNKRIRVSVQGPDIAIHADPEKLRIVVDNLLSNAIRYSPPDGAIEIALHRNDETATLDVSDEGPGIQEGEREKVFDAFYRGAVEAKSAIKGTGLGLSIAREYVLAHQGDITVLGKQGPGALVRVRLPLVQRKFDA